MNRKLNNYLINSYCTINYVHVYVRFEQETCLKLYATFRNINNLIVHVVEIIQALLCPHQKRFIIIKATHVVEKH